MPKPWLKSWTSSLDKEKIQSLTGDQFKFWTNLLWIAQRADKNGELPPMASIAFQARVSLELVQNLVDEQVKLVLVEKRGSRYVIHDWKHWQGDGKSDAQRKKEQRDRSRDTSRDIVDEGHVTESNGVTNVSHLRARAETKTKTKTRKDPPTPRKRGKPAAPAEDVSLPDWLPVEAWSEFVEMRKKIKVATPQSFKHIVKELDRLRRLGFSPEAVLSRSIMNSWAGVFAIPAERMNGSHSKAKVPEPEITPEQKAEADRLIERINREAEERRNKLFKERKEFR